MNEKAERLYRKSARLRHTLDIAEVCGFSYQITKSPYGGFFDVYQLEMILATLRKQRALIDGLPDGESSVDGLAPHGDELGGGS